MLDPNPDTYVPSTPAEFAGHAAVVAAFMVKQIAKSRANNFKPIKVLFNGPPGAGKSALVKFMRNHAGIHPLFSTTKINGTKLVQSAIDDMEYNMQFRSLYGDYKLFWIEEADAIPNAAQIRFLTTMDDVPNGCIIACTSNCTLKEFEERFQTRFLIQHLVKVPQADIAVLLRRFVSPEHADGIASTANGNVRQALLDAEGLLIAMG